MGFSIAFGDCCFGWCHLPLPKGLGEGSALVFCVCGGGGGVNAALGFMVVALVTLVSVMEKSGE